jgi:biuret amidohydrolase
MPGRKPFAVPTAPPVECLLLSDCTGATDPGTYRSALHMIKMQGGGFGAVAASEALLDTSSAGVGSTGR